MRRLNTSDKADEAEVTDWMLAVSFPSGDRWMLTRSTALASCELGPNADSREAYARDELVLVVFWERIVRMLETAADMEMRVRRQQVG